VPTYFLDGFFCAAIASAPLDPMKRLLWALTGIVLVLALLVVYWAVPWRPAPRAIDLVPSDTLVFVQVRDSRSARYNFVRSPALALWKEPQVQALLAQPLQSVQDAVGDQYARRLSRSLDQILLAPQGETFLAVTHLSLPLVQPGIVVGADMRGNLFKAKLAVLNLEFSLRRYNKGASVLQSRRYQGVRYKAWRVRPATTICYTFFRSMVIVTVGEESMREVIGHFQHGNAPQVDTLAGSADYQNFCAALPTEGDAVAYLNPSPVLRRLGPMLFLSPPLAAALQPVTNIEGAGLSLRFTTNAVHETQVTQFRSGAHEPPPPNTRQSLRFTQPTTLAYAVRSVDCEAAYVRLVQLISASGRPRWNLRVAVLEHTLRQKNVDLYDDVLAKLGPEIAVVANWRESAELPDAALVVQVADSPELREALGILLKVLKKRTLGTDEQSPWEELIHRGHLLHIARLGAGKIAPTYFFSDGFLVLASDPDCARDLIEHIISTNGTLAASRTYQIAVAQLPPGNDAFTYCDLATLYGRARPLIQDVARQVATGMADPSAHKALPALLQRLARPPWAEWVLRLQRLPETEVVVPHLSAFAAATQDDPRRRTTFSVSPFGTPTGLLAMGVGGLAAPEALATLRQTATRANGPKTSSDKAVPPVPPGNQTGASQTPPTR